MLGRKERRQREQGVAKDETDGKLWETAKDRGACHSAVYEATESQTRLSNRTTTTAVKLSIWLAGHQAKDSSLVTLGHQGSIHI